MSSRSNFLRDICRFIHVRKVLKLTPKLKLFPIFDTSGETMCSYTTPHLKFLPFSQCQKLPQEIRLRPGNHFFLNRKHKNSNFWDFLVKLYDGEARFRSQNYFSQAEISYESKGVLSDQMQVSEVTEPKILK